MEALGPLGPVVAPPQTPAHAWLDTPVRTPLVLAPSGPRGWFGGTTLVALDPVTSEAPAAGEALRVAGDALDEAMRSSRPLLAVALLRYEGDAVVLTYERGVLLTTDGWRPWGAWEAPADAAPPKLAGADRPAVRLSGVAPGMDRGAYTDAVDAVRERIRAGDVYVLNLTRTVSAGTDASPRSLFERLAEAGEQPMAAALALPDGSAVLSASPERFLRWSGGAAAIEPVKGTRPRGDTPALDAALADALAASAKERAEHVMVVDLERNDLGRVCEPGSISVKPLFAVETTPYCHQAHSVVSGRTRPGVGAARLLEATFPCGSVTGAPKLAAIRIAGELEAGPRGAYTGSLVVAVPGSLDSSVLIRTAELTAGGRVTYGTGCGVTVDSDPDEEWAESVLKSRPLLGAVPPVALRETCRLAGGRVPLWELHRARLARGGCGEAVLAAADRAVAEAVAAWAGPDSPRLRLTVDVTPEGDVRARVERRLSSLDVPGGPRIALVTVEEPPALPPGAAKPSDRGPWDDAQRRARAAGAEVAVLVDTAGNVVDGGTCTVWAVVDGAVVTPPAPPAVAGVARAFVLDALARGGSPAREQPIRTSQLDEADELFLTNAFGGVVPVRGRGPGPVCDRVARLFDEVWRPRG